MADITAVWQAVPVSPDDTDDCCQRLIDRTTVDTRTHASEWLVFLTALGCVQESGDGYYRTEFEPDDQTLRDGFTSRLFGVDQVLTVLDTADEALSVDAVITALPERTRQRISRTTDLREYIARLLDWGVTFDVFERHQHRYTSP